MAIIGVTPRYSLPRPADTVLMLCRPARGAQVREVEGVAYLLGTRFHKIF